MRRSYVIASLALAVGAISAPFALAGNAHSHTTTAPVHYTVVGVADTAATCPAGGVTLDRTTYRPANIGTKGSQLAVVFGPKTKFSGHSGHRIGCARVKAGDRLIVSWTEPHGTAFDATLPATHVVDTGSKHHHV